MAKKGQRLREEEKIIIRDSEKVIKEGNKAVEKTNIVLREVALSTKSDVFKRLEEFEKHWNEMCEKFEATEMPRRDAESWDAKFHIDRLKFQMSIPPSFQDKVYNEVYPRLDRTEHKVGVAILKAKANFREKEKIRLKEAYGFLGALIYFILKITGRI